MKKKVLFVATVDSHIELFHLPYLKMFKDHGYEVHVATNSNKKIKYCDKKIKLPIERSPFRLSNLKAIFVLKKILKTEKYDSIHCHTPMGGVVARLAAKKARRAGTRVIYTAHGFHFYEGAPILNWMLYYPVEKWLSKYTDTLITINEEDFERAKRKFYCNDVHKINGIGVDQKKFDKSFDEKEKRKLKKSLGIKEKDFVVTYIAELDPAKNQAMAIKSISQLKSRGVNNIKLLLVGADSYNGKYQKMVDKLNLGDSVKFLGFRPDVDAILSISNLEIGTSRREGLGLHLAEAMYMNVPVVATINRGHEELIKDSYNGFLVWQNSSEDLADAIFSIIVNDAKKERFIKNAKKYVEKFLLSNVEEKMTEIYSFEEEQPLRVLHIFNTMIYGGAENMVMNVYRNIDRSKIQFDFLVHGDCVFADEIKSLGGKIYTLPGYINKLGPIKYGKNIRNFFKNNKQYKIVHCHLDRTSGFVLSNIKKIYNPVCISHAHCCESANKNILIRIYKKYLKWRLKKSANLKIACSKEAGDWVFGNGYKVVDNPVDANVFGLNSVMRDKTRELLNMDDKDFVIGTVGRLEPVKNQQLLIEAYKKAFPKAYYKHAKLIIVGDGTLKSSIEGDISNDARIHLIKPVPDVAKYYNAFDLFTISSGKEGLPLALLEAYCNGLPIIASKGMPGRVLKDIGVKAVKTYEVDDWAKELKKAYKSKAVRRESMLNKKYDVKFVTHKMEKIYSGCKY